MLGVGKEGGPAVSRAFKEYEHLFPLTDKLMQMLAGRTNLQLVARAERSGSWAKSMFSANRV
jgi:hypothetical protein